MGRYFKVAKPEYLEDIIYQPPWELMKNVIDTHDSRIKEGEDEMDASDKLLAQVNNLKTDDPDVNNSIKGYRDKINSLTENLQGDYANYNKYLPEISKLRRQLTSDMDNGILGKAQEQFNQREKIAKETDKMKNVNSKRKAAFMKYLDNVYKDKGGLAFKDTNNYNKFLDEELNPEEDVDIDKWTRQMDANIKANKKAFASADANGGYLWNSSRTELVRDAKKVKDSILDHPTMKKWESMTKQDALFEGYNELGLRGSQLDNFVKEKLRLEKEDFVNATVSALTKSEETKAKNVRVDGRDLAEYRRGNQLEDKYGPVVYTEREENTLSGDEKAYASTQHRRIRNSLVGTDLTKYGLKEDFTENDFVKTWINLNPTQKREMLKTINTPSNRTYKDPITGLERKVETGGVTMQNINTLLSLKDKEGVVVPFFDVKEEDKDREGKLTPQAIQRRVKEEKAYLTALSRRSPSEKFKVEVEDKDGDFQIAEYDPNLSKRLFDMATNKTVNPNDYGAGKSQVSFEVPETFAYQGKKAYKSEDGVIITTPKTKDGGGEIITNKDEAIKRAAEMGTSLKMKENTQTVTVMGKKMNVLGYRRPDRIKTVSGKDLNRVHFRLQDPVTKEITEIRYVDSKKRIKIK